MKTPGEGQSFGRQVKRRHEIDTMSATYERYSRTLAETRILSAAIA